jgi:hypothetical protein
MKRENNRPNRLTGFSKSPLECSAGQMTFIPLSKEGETASRKMGNYLSCVYSPKIREVYDSLKLGLFKIIYSLPKIV